MLANSLEGSSPLKWLRGVVAFVIALIVEREARVGAEREANMKRALTQEPRFARPCTMLSTMLTLASSVSVKC